MWAEGRTKDDTMLGDVEDLRDLRLCRVVQVGNDDGQVSGNLYSVKKYFIALLRDVR